jgi:hypothetical protein
MRATIDSILGWDFNKHRVAALGVDGEVYHADPELVADLKSNPSATLKTACVHAMINPEAWTWRHFDVDSVLYYSDMVKTKTKARIGF